MRSRLGRNQLGENSHSTFAEAYVHGLQDLLESGHRVPPIEDPTSIGSNFGRSRRSTRELFGYSFRVDDPRYSLVLTPSHPISLSFCVGLLIWTIAGSDDSNWIGYYNPQATLFSDDGAHIAAAFGRRLFANDGGTDQVEAVVKRVTADPSSRRTLAVIADAEDNTRSSRDYSCAIGVQYLRRDGKLHALTFMRSQSALKVLRYDAFLFMTLQSWLAARMELEVGCYQHIAGSFHLYDDELPLARRVLTSGVKATRLGDMRAPEQTMDDLLRFERALRDATTGGDRQRLSKVTIEELSRPDDPSFFGQARRILLIHATERAGVPLRQKLLEGLPPSLADTVIGWSRGVLLTPQGSG